MTQVCRLCRLCQNRLLLSPLNSALEARIGEKWGGPTQPTQSTQDQESVDEGRLDDEAGGPPARDTASDRAKRSLMPKENAPAAHRHPGRRPIVTPCHATPCLAVPCLWKARHRRRRRASNVRCARQAVRQPQSLRRGCGCRCPGRQGPDHSRSLALRGRRRSVEHGPPSEGSLPHASSLGEVKMENWG